MFWSLILLERLENLALREKILALILLSILGVFVAFKTYEAVFQDFFEQNTHFDSSLLNENKRQILHLKSLENELNQSVLRQNLILENHKNENSYLVKNYEDYLKSIENLSKKHNLLIKNLKSSHNTHEHFQIFRLNLELSGEFPKLLLFIKELENLDFIFAFESIEFQNTKGLNLSIHLDLKFVSLK
ncbi:hypothetical protein [Campylobacter helveticus]|uniref:hypothetical protein n=1 Tax=Campylobacter helveticus TaxID=28898 RepID=UPI0014866522|nr:hypothetical protein [Campylobacter helveticus]